MVVLATAATVIASQAVITGAYSLTQQAIQLGLLPRLDIRHTSASLVGQIYIPRVNWLLARGRLVAGRTFPLLERARFGLRDRGDRHDGGDHDHGLRRGLADVGLESRGRRCA